MRIDRLYIILKINMDIVPLAILVALITIFGGIGVYLAEHGHPGANITNLGPLVGCSYNSDRRLW